MRNKELDYWLRTGDYEPQFDYGDDPHGKIFLIARPMIQYSIRFNDGSYHHHQGIGNSTEEKSEARRYNSIKEAQNECNYLMGVDAIVQITLGEDQVVHKFK